MQPSARLISVQVGPVATYPLPGREGQWQTAIVKHPLEGPVWLDVLGLAGDAQADSKHHGGPGQAVNVYPSEHYPFWRETPGLEDISGGGFGENFTTQGLLEDTACIGDLYRVGQALVWLTQPRVPCYKLDRRWQQADLCDRATHLGKTGWYFAVRQPGFVQAGDPIELLERPNPQWTIARVWTVYPALNNPEAMRSLAQAAGLADKLRAQLEKKLAAGG